MKKILFFLFLTAGVAIQAQAQKYFSRDGKIAFEASSPLEKIEAVNKGTTVVVDAATGAVEMAVLIKGFIFEKALMQEHFNENYLESGKFPKATFKGKIQNASDVKWTEDGTYPIKVKGVLNLHGVERQVSAPARIVVQKGRISAGSDFEIVLADYNITIPSVVADKIAKAAKVNLNADLAELKR